MCYPTIKNLQEVFSNFLGNPSQNGKNWNRIRKTFFGPFQKSSSENFDWQGMWAEETWPWPFFEPADPNQHGPIFVDCV